MNGPAFLRRAANAALSQSQQAYRTYVEHCSTCHQCEGTNRCTSADDLWSTYQALRAGSELSRPRKAR